MMDEHKNRRIIPSISQDWFKDDFLMDLRVTPNYEDFSCKFEMDRAPLPVDEDPAFAVPCLLQCPSKAPLRPLAKPKKGPSGEQVDATCALLPETDRA